MGIHLVATHCCFTCGNKLGLMYIEPITKHGPEHGFYACPKHRADGMKRQALEDMGPGEAYDAYCAAMRKLSEYYCDTIPKEPKGKGKGMKSIKDMEMPW